MKSLLEVGPVSSVGTIMSVWVLSGRFVFVWVWGFTGGGGGGVLDGGISQGVLLVLTIAVPGSNALGGVEAWVLSG